jgi:hypothetical protein
MQIETYLKQLEKPSVGEIAGTWVRTQIKRSGTLTLCSLREKTGEVEQLPAFIRLTLIPGFPADAEKGKPGTPGRGLNTVNLMLSLRRDLSNHSCDFLEEAVQRL